MELFDKKYVHFMWEDELVGKEVITAEGIDSLKAQVNRCHISFDVVRESPDSEFPFYAIKTHCVYRFAYYDPNYRFKCAYVEGIQLQFSYDGTLWVDIQPDWKISDFDTTPAEFRIKPDAKNMTLNYVVQGEQSGSFEARAKMFKDLIEEAGKELGVSLTAGYIQSCDDSENVLISDSLSDKEVYYDTLADIRNVQKYGNNIKPEEQKRGYTLSEDILGLWEQTVCEIRSEIKSWHLKGPYTIDYAKGLCDKLEHSMCALAGGNYKLRYSID